MKISKYTDKLTTTQSEMARILGVTQPRVNQMIQEEIIIKDKSGAVFIVESLKNFYKLRSIDGAGDNEIDLMEERALHEKVKREIAELKLKKLQGNIYDAKHVELVMIEILSTLRTQLLGLPNKLAPLLEGKTRDEIYNLTTREIEEKLMELSDYSPELFTEEELEDEIPE